MSRLSKLSVANVDLTNKRVIVRVDYNVPLDDDAQITNDQRIKASLPTLEYTLSQNPACLILMSHLGRPDGQRAAKYSLAPVAKALSRLLKRPVTFLDDCVGPETTKACLEARNGQVLLLENLRFHVEEEGSGVDPATGRKTKAGPESVRQFRAALSALGEVYVNDAFGTAHRAHSSMVGIQLAVRAAGFLLHKELGFFAKALEAPLRPFVTILGGAKVSDKIVLIEHLLDKVDALIIAGGMAYTFKKAVERVAIGSSIFDDHGASLVQTVVAKAAARNVRLYFPVDHVVADSFSNDAKTKTVTDAQGIPDGWLGMDVGPRSIETFDRVLRGAKTILWNGPVGVFEMPSFEAGTRAVLDSVIAATETHEALSIVGGGDTATAVEKWHAESRLSHVSTGGGASLELLEGKELPGVAALCDA